MKGYNVLVIYDEVCEKLLMCKRRKSPYKGLSNFTGGKIEEGEIGIEAAYRELFEETSISRADVTLSHLMDLIYYFENFRLEVYAGRLNKTVELSGDENDLYWSEPDRNFFDGSEFAGDGNIGHIMAQACKIKDKL